MYDKNRRKGAKGSLAPSIDNCLGLTAFCNQFQPMVREPASPTSVGSNLKKRKMSETSDFFPFLESIIRDPGLQTKLQKIKEYDDDAENSDGQIQSDFADVLKELVTIRDAL